MSAEDLESLYRKWLAEHAGVVLTMARAYTRTTEDCQDLAQEILLQVWVLLAAVSGPGGWWTVLAMSGMAFMEVIVFGGIYWLSRVAGRSEIESRRRELAMLVAGLDEASPVGN